MFIDMGGGSIRVQSITVERRQAMVRIFINGKQVTKDEISQYEITNERVKKILLKAGRGKEAENLRADQSLPCTHTHDV